MTQEQATVFYRTIADLLATGATLEEIKTEITEEQTAIKQETEIMAELEAVAEAAFERDGEK